MPTVLSLTNRAVSASVLLLAGCLLASGCAGLRLLDRAGAPPHESPSIQAQARLLQDAHRLLNERHPKKALVVLRKMIDSHPTPAFPLELHWALAEAHEQLGDLDAAVVEYRYVLKVAVPASADNADFRHRAARRLAKLEPNLAGTAKRSREVTAILISPALLPPQAERPRWLRSLAEAGITTLVLEAGTTSRSPVLPSGSSRNDLDGQSTPSGVYFRTNWATVLDDLIDRVVPQAHEQGLAVFAAVTLTRMSWLEPPVGWADWAYDTRTGELRRSVALDLFHPAFEDYLVGFLDDLADTGIDGILFRADVTTGMTHGLSPSAREAFLQRFGLELDPQDMFSAGSPTPGRASTSSLNSRGSSQSDHPPEFWRWAGWKARERVAVMDRLKRSLQQGAPNLSFALEVHPEAVLHPVEALVHYGEDLLEAKHAGFDHVLIGLGRQPDSLPPPLTGAGSSRTDPRATHQAVQEAGNAVGRGAQDLTNRDLLDRLLEIMGAPGQVWITKRVALGTADTLGQHLSPQADRALIDEGIGLVYVPVELAVP
ncbi:MAG: hypothetical protein V3R16_06175 [Nitrospirales bacterium]